jgi:hypothetical protein
MHWTVNNSAKSLQSDFSSFIVLLVRFCTDNESKKMKQLDKLNRDLAELRSRLQYQKFELERAENSNNEFKATLSFNRASDLLKLIRAKQDEIMNFMLTK